MYLLGLSAFFIRLCVIFFSYRKAINPSPAIWAAALKTHTIPFPFPTQYLSGGATASMISTGVGGAPCDPQCTGWWTLPATWWRWGRRTGPAAGSSWSRCSPSWQGQAQALSDGGEENSTSHRTGSLFLSHLGPRAPALWPWTGDPNLRKPLSTGTRGPSVLSQPRPGPNNAPSGDRRLQKGRSWPRGTRETHQSTRVSGTAWLTLNVQKHLVTSLFLSLTLSLSPSLRKQCFSQQKKTIVLFLLPQDNDFVLIISGKDTAPAILISLSAKRLTRSDKLSSSAETENNKTKIFIMKVLKHPQKKNRYLMNPNNNRPQIEQWFRMGWEVEGRFKRERTHVYLWLIYVDVCQKSAQHCTAIILQLKINI